MIFGESARILDVTVPEIVIQNLDKGCNTHVIHVIYQDTSYNCSITVQDKKLKALMMSSQC